MNNYTLSLLVILSLTLNACIGTDQVDDPEVLEEEKIEISAEINSLTVGSTALITSSYFNEYGELAEIPFEWVINNPDIISINENVVTALAQGQATIYASAKDINNDPLMSNEIMFTVISDLTDLASVTLDAVKNNLEIGEELQLTYALKDGNGDPYEGMDFSWNSTDSSVVSITQEGLAKALSNGMGKITLTVDSISSMPYVITVGGEVRFGTFQNLHYNASGSCSLSMEGDNVVLKLGNDFKTELLLGTWIYMANSLEGDKVKSSGLAVANISESIEGAQTFNLTGIDAEIELADYKYVVILCEPASITMGYAELN